MDNIIANPNRHQHADANILELSDSDLVAYLQEHHGPSGFVIPTTIDFHLLPTDKREKIAGRLR
jgi:hypothetical protein